MTRAWSEFGIDEPDARTRERVIALGPGDLHRLLHGLLAGPPPPGFVAGGCVLGDDAPVAVCRQCGFTW